ncbi:hypothetical protein [Paenibacillus sp. FSL H3-0333]|uniref:hypothetical protein n=1 Tax=Paenibacillus sp. FSL H3-0333 TaxID=2921373 RepID=UPI0030F94073
MEFQPFKSYYRNIIKERYAYNCEYIMYTIKSGEEEYLDDKVLIPSDEELNEKQLIEILGKMIHKQIDEQTKYDNYDIAKLYSVRIDEVYDREL